MSADYPPPQPPAPGQNPYAQQPPPPPGQPAAYGGPDPYGQPGSYGQPGPYGPPAPGAAPGTPYGAPQQPGGFAPPPYPAPAYPAPAPAPGNPALALLAGLGAMLVAALVYGLLIKGTKHEIGYAALGVGALVGLAVGKLGGRNPVLPVLAIPLALLGVYFGQIFGLTLLVTSGTDTGVFSALTNHYDFIQRLWKHSMDAKDYFFFAIAGIEAFVIARRVAN